MEVHILSVPTVREADGLALSSRNALMTEEQRRYAPQIHRALKVAAEAFRAGERDAQMILGRAGSELAAWRQQGFSVDYMQVVDPETLAPRDTAQPGDRVLFAGTLGNLRLLDNIMLEEDVLNIAGL